MLVCVSEIIIENFPNMNLNFHNCFNITFYEHVRHCNEKEIKWRLWAQKCLPQIFFHFSVLLFLLLLLWLEGGGLFHINFTCNPNTDEKEIKTISIFLFTLGMPSIFLFSSDNIETLMCVCVRASFLRFIFSIYFIFISLTHFVLCFDWINICIFFPSDMNSASVYVVDVFSGKFMYLRFAMPPYLKFISAYIFLHTWGNYFSFFGKREMILLFLKKQKIK
jgi:hypothetical protein